MMARVLGTLRGRLTLVLALPLLAVLAVSVVADYRTALALANESYDHALLGTARALSSRLEGDEDDAPLELDLPPAAEAILRADPQDTVRYAVVQAGGRLIAGDRVLLGVALNPPPGMPQFADLSIDGRAMRVVASTYANAHIRATVLVAESTYKRERATKQILAAVIWPNVLLLSVTLVVVYFGVRLGLRPLDALGRQIDERGLEDFAAVGEQGVPGEARPLVAAMNRLMARLELAGRAQQAFLSSAAHQLRTPLAGMQTQLELAAADLPAEARPRIERLRESTGRLIHFTRQMLALARSSPDAVAAVRFEVLDLADLLEECASDFLDAALERGVELAFEPAPARIEGAPWMLRELLGNLVDNAIVHAPAGGAVAVRCGSGPGSAWLEVEDEGSGIPADLRERVFERFYRAPGAPAGGSGLGLAIVREVAARHGATLAVGEGAAGRGTRIRVAFPVRG
ncbi:sensor histidine kinase [Cognatazoarcus halotolerans]|uniref:sensor histidine kinase n=1 Tax=Cognatazoarcus halotolerans TaxID=2686016 RepID=UPI00135BE156|nr:sensor histidine kinase [Cognatazoarcus halotolerans]MCB1901664.1 sensor histidine kinase [Rhodocyclaceae bacterium]MCP5310803.1 sensor histidine kinase [Zoogloeaceae bacterium]